ncbi:MAG: hypothetical protein O3A13_12505, partial [Proteobacteria bacterium]|nr:hypothetical protein [Pseudomonadota bacterium]
VSFSFLLSSFTSLWHFNALTRCPVLVDHFIYNMIRASSGGLIALALELKSTSNISLEGSKDLDELADLIIAFFLPGDVAKD